MYMVYVYLFIYLICVYIYMFDMCVCVHDNEGKKLKQPPIWEWFIPPIFGDDWGMVYYCFTYIYQWCA